jgi:hypothetical protein
MTAMVSKFGRLIIWENDAENKGRIIAKIRCAELRDIPKSVRFTEGEQPETESWTFSVEVLSQTLLGAGPQDEDPIPDDGIDPHPLPVQPFQPPVIQEPAANAWDNQQVEPFVQHEGVAQNQNNAFDDLINAMEMEADLPKNNQANNDVQAIDNQSSITLTEPFSEGVNSVNNPAVFIQNLEVNQLQMVPVDDNVIPGPVIVHGNEQGLNFNNFMQLGEGVQNIMLACLDLEENDESDGDLNDNSEEERSMDLSNDNVLVPPEVAHLQMGFVHTYFFPVPNKQDLFSEFSEEGMKLWDKYFAPHCANEASSIGTNVFQIPVSWFNFITLMLLSPEKFDWTKGFLCSPLWNILSEADTHEDFVTFVIPEKCCVQQKPTYKISELVDEEKSLDSGKFPSDKEEGLEGLADQAPPNITPHAPKKKRRANVNLVESEVRRSPKISELNEGFKDHSNCNNKHCLPCNSAPPTLKSNLVKNLAISFCKVKEDGLDKRISRPSKSRRMGAEDADQGPSKKNGKAPMKDGAPKGKGKKDAGGSPQHGRKKT